MPDDFLLIGIDGGATKVSGWSVSAEKKDTFSLGKYHAAQSYRKVPGYIEDFTAVNIQKQLDEFQSDDIQPTDQEIQHGKTYTQSAAQVIQEIAEQSGYEKVLVGIGMPGLKTKDGRGIAVMANGPRNIQYCDRVEAILAEHNIELVQPIAHLGSDAFYCGLGEEYAKDGQFRQVENGYYLGGGTGTADALKLRGELVSLDDIKSWFVKTWEMQNAEGLSLEKCASAKGIQEIYGQYRTIDLNELNRREIYPPQIRESALQGEKAALQTFQTVTRNLAALIYERITTLYLGWQGQFDFINPNKPQPEKTHPYHGLLLNAIIIGQRLGELFHAAEGDDILWKPFFDRLTDLIVNSKDLDKTAKLHYCPDGHFLKSLLKTSKLREAPALGAGIDAYLSWHQ